MFMNHDTVKFGIFGNTYEINMTPYKIPAPIHGCWVKVHDVRYDNRYVSVVDFCDFNNEVFINCDGIDVEEKIELAIKHIRGWSDYYYIGNMMNYTAIPESLSGEETRCFSALWINFSIQWSKDKSCWQYKHREDNLWIESDVYTNDVQPSHAHFLAWVLSTITKVEE